MLAGVLMILYLHFIQIPKNILYWKKKKGFAFPELEAKGFLEDWVPEEYVDEIYGDEILQEFAHFAREEEEVSEVETDRRLREMNARNHHSKMQAQLNKLYVKRRKTGRKTIGSEEDEDSD